MVRLVFVVFLIQTGFHGFTGALPVALSDGGLGSTDIGFIVGAASISLIIAAPISGVLLDRLGSLRMMTLGGMAYVAGAGLLAILPVTLDMPLWPWLVARGLQGVGFAVVIPAALTLVPEIVPGGRRGLWLTVTLLSQNITLAVMPAISLAVLRASSLTGVAIMIGSLVALGTVLVRSVPRPNQELRVATHPTARRRLGLAYRATWTAPLGVALLSVCYWGLVLAHLPPRAEAVGMGAGLYFIGYGVAVVTTRLPAGWLADRRAASPMILAGLAVSLVSVALLIPPPTELLLIASGATSGIASGLVMSPLLLELSRLSSGADRGSAFAMFAVATGAAQTIGSIGGALIIVALGFTAALAAGMIAIVLAGALTITNTSLRTQWQTE